MHKARLNYDGWFALPAAARRALGVDTGDQLEVEVVDGRIVLRPLKASAAADSFADEPTPPPVEPEAAAAATAPSAVKRGPGRPRKAIAAPSAAGTVLP